MLAPTGGNIYRTQKRNASNAQGHMPSRVDNICRTQKENASSEQGRMHWERSASACVKKIKKSALKINIDDVKSVVSLFYAG